MHDATAYSCWLYAYIRSYAGTYKNDAQTFSFVAFLQSRHSFTSYIAMYAVIGILRVILVSSFAAMVAADAPHIEYERTGSCSVSIIL